MRFSRALTRLFALLLAAIFLAAGCLAWADYLVGAHGDGRIFTRLEDVQPVDAALVLGTSKFVATGRPNLFYDNRIRAAAGLYQAGKVRAIVVSGDNSTMSYNEPQRMKQDLVEMGVPAEYVTCDYAGRRTLDSVVRMKEVFGISRYVIVSQEFHLRRALYIADARGHDAVGLVADDAATGIKLRLREMVARAMAVLDVNVFERNPKFLGDPVPVRLKEPESTRP